MNWVHQPDIFHSPDVSQSSSIRSCAPIDTNSSSSSCLGAAEPPGPGPQQDLPSEEEEEEDPIDEEEDFCKMQTPADRQLLKHYKFFHICGNFQKSQKKVKQEKAEMLPNLFFKKCLIAFLME